MKVNELLKSVAQSMSEDTTGNKKTLPCYIEGIVVDVTIDEGGNVTKEETGIHVSARITPKRNGEHQ